MTREPSPQALALYEPFLRRHIDLVRPRLLLLAGGTPLTTVLGGDLRITRARGQWFSYSPGQAPGQDGSTDSIPTLATYHPSFLLRTPAAKAQAWQDLLTFREKLRTLLSA